MRIIREYTCSSCGATEEHFSDSNKAMVDDHRPHYECRAAHQGHLLAILSATPTNFRFADDSPSKHRRSHS